MTEMFTAFRNRSRLASGTRAEIAAALLALGEGPQPDGVLVFSDETGRETDLDLSGGAAAVAARYGEARGRGRPKLGVVSREVTLLPRHWDWLATQRGGASAALRRLIDAARAEAGDTAARRDAAYRFCATIAGDLPGFEEAMRRLYKGDADGFARTTADWPRDIANHARKMLE